MAKEILIVQVGNAERPADEAAIKDVTKNMKRAMKSAGVTDKVLFVTPHAINMYTLSSIDYNKVQDVLQLFDKGLIGNDEAKLRLGV
jgi:hypothetical protein